MSASACQDGSIRSGWVGVVVIGHRSEGEEEERKGVKLIFRKPRPLGTPGEGAWGGMYESIPMYA